MEWDFKMAKDSAGACMFEMIYRKMMGNIFRDQKKYSLNNPYDVYHGVSMRMIVDFADMDNSLHVLPTGESGQLKSPNYKDQIPLYLNGRYHPSWTGRHELERHSQGTLTLKPR